MRLPAILPVRAYKAFKSPTVNAELEVIERLGQGRELRDLFVVRDGETIVETASGQIAARYPGKFGQIATHPDGRPVQLYNDVINRPTPEGQPDYHDTSVFPLLWSAAANNCPRNGAL